MKHGISFILGIMLVFLSASVYAEDYPTYTGKKLGRGLANTAFGWTEALGRQEKIADEHGIVEGIFWGTLDGVGNAVKRTGIGLYEVATFPIKTSENANALMEPEFPSINDRAGYRPKDYTF